MVVQSSTGQWFEIIKLVWSLKKIILEKTNEKSKIGPQYMVPLH
jgi:hypothetical protein